MTSVSTFNGIPVVYAVTPRTAPDYFAVPVVQQTTAFVTTGNIDADAVLPKGRIKWSALATAGGTYKRTNPFSNETVGLDANAACVYDLIKRLERAGDRRMLTGVKWFRKHHAGAYDTLLD
jgi:hypothetical protein